MMIDLYIYCLTIYTLYLYTQRSTEEEEEEEEEIEIYNEWSWIHSMSHSLWHLNSSPYKEPFFLKCLSFYLSICFCICAYLFESFFRYCLMISLKILFFIFKALINPLPIPLYGFHYITLYINIFHTIVIVQLVNALLVGIRPTGLFNYRGTFEKKCFTVN